MAAFRNRATTEYRHIEDDAIKKELVNAGIPVLTLPVYTCGEVKTKHIGLLNGFVFVRSWRYWACMGDMPFGAAKEIFRQFEDLGIRAEGHAGNIAPQGYCPEGIKQAQDIIEKMQSQKASTTEIVAALEKVEVAPGTPRYVAVYHIDTEEGLAALAKYIQDNSIFAYNGAAGSYTASVFR